THASPFRHAAALTRGKEAAPRNRYKSRQCRCSRTAPRCVRPLLESVLTPESAHIRRRFGSSLSSAFAFPSAHSAPCLAGVSAERHLHQEEGQASLGVRRSDASPRLATGW